uniref:Uncharacterized protein n=1 Tax=Aegilops tauschii subsp. strangulata TaxID=200361 RepID=A0A453QCZ0_AEGTS
MFSSSVLKLREQAARGDDCWSWIWTEEVRTGHGAPPSDGLSVFLGGGGDMTRAKRTTQSKSGRHHPPPPAAPVQHRCSNPALPSSSRCSSTDRAPPPTDRAPRLVKISPLTDEGETGC